MKKPYREGMWFDVPLGDGQRVPAVLLRDRHHVLDIAAYARNGELAWLGTTSDRGLLVRRWRPIDRPNPAPALPAPVASPRFLRTPLAERTIARACGVAIPSEPPLRVYDLGRIRVEEFSEFDKGSRLQWRSPLAKEQLRACAAWYAAHRGGALRLYGAALEQLPEVSDFGVRDLTLGGVPDRALPAMPSVERLSLEAAIPLDRVVAAFPNVRALRVSARDQTIDVAPLRELEHLSALDLAQVCVDTWNAFAEIDGLRALRVARVANMPGIEPLLALSLASLAIEEQTTLRDLAPLAAMASLEQIELRGLWQYNVDDMAWLYRLPELKRATIDIGGRRKNVEIYRRASWACAWPFYFEMA